MSWCEGGWCAYGWAGDAPALSVEIHGNIPAFSGLAEVSPIANVVAHGTIPAFNGNAECTVTYQAIIHGTIPAFGGSSEINVNATVEIHGMIPAFNGSAEITLVPQMTIHGNIPGFTGKAYLTITPVAADVTYTGVVINTMNNAHSEFIDYNFNSFADFNGNYYMASDDGLFKETYDDSVIPFVFKTGKIDSWKGTESMAPSVKRDMELYLNYLIDNLMMVKVTGDKEDSDYSYYIKYNRRNLGKGYKSRYFEFEFSNFNSKEFGLEAIRVLANPTIRTR